MFLPSFRLSCLLALLPALLVGRPEAASAQQAGYGQTFGNTPMERQVYDAGTGKSNGGSILDSTNPIDLINKLRRGSAMEDATPPASAIDQALKDLEIQAKPAALMPPAPGAGAQAAPQPAAAMSRSAGLPQMASPRSLAPTASSLVLPPQAGPLLPAQKP
jgi:hypothetical protein